MPNRALAVNQRVFENANLAITTHGSDWYFAVCAVMSASFLAVVVLTFRKPRRDRLFHYMSAGLLLVAAIAYFSMGSGLGQVPIEVEFRRGGSLRVAGTREIFWVRYVDWFITTPLLLLDLLLTAGLPWPTILMAILADEVMVVCGLVGALIPTTYKWGYFTFATVAFLYVVSVLVFDGRSHARAFGGEIQRTYMTCGVLLIGIWFLYPIAWGVSEGGNVIHPDSEAVFYGILDLIAKPVFTGLLLFGHRKIDPGVLGVAIREPGPMNSGHAEKHAIGQSTGVASAAAAHNGHGNGASSSGVQPTAAAHNGHHAAQTNLAPATVPTAV
ncbi:FDD123 protein [Stachybotrys elegans]|uniref:Opsin-like protein carO n=1 Tax=Stachybotrys elegans TaxID=80388 RepID=A0A8K0SLM5_9HYPO|nr:FDD123 protein [Stachybotrys elegans]